MENELPEGWIESTFGVVGDIVTGNTPSKVFPEYYDGGTIPWVKPGDINKSVEIINTEDYLTELGAEKARLLPVGSVMITCIGNLGNVAIAGVEVATNQQINSVVVKHPFLDQKYLYYYALTMKPWLSANSTSTTISMVNKSNFEKAPILIPPLAEQTRIVAKLDAAFGHLETLKMGLARIPELLKKFRQTVLTQAVTGKLTEEWREENGLIHEYEEKDDLSFSIPNHWQTNTLRELADSHILGKMLDQNKNKGDEYLYLRNINVRWFDFKLSDLLIMRINANEKDKFSVENGDLFVCEGGEPGRAAIWRNGPNNLIFQKALHRIRFGDLMIPDWFLYNLKLDADNGRLSEYFTGTGIAHLTLKSLSKYIVPVPPLEEQKEIVNRVESLFATADALEAQYQSLKAKIDQLPQALLAKAFRGELVLQNPTDEPASVLLEKIKGLTAAVGGKKKTKAGQTALAFMEE